MVKFDIQVIFFPTYDEKHIGLVFRGLRTGEIVENWYIRSLFKFRAMI